jgi:hypothetical protein
LYCIREDIAQAASATRASDPSKFPAAAADGTTQQKNSAMSQDTIRPHCSARSASTSAGSDRSPRLIAKSASNASVDAATTSWTSASRPVPKDPYGSASQPGSAVTASPSSASDPPVTGSRSRSSASTASSRRAVAGPAGPAIRSTLCTSAPWISR